jgi:outer membrane protein assembly factor BamB
MFKKIMTNGIRPLTKLVAVAIFATTVIGSAVYAEKNDGAYEFVKTNNGVIVVIGADDATSILECAKKTDATIQLLHTNATIVEKLRKQIDKSSSAQIRVQKWDGGKLPYAKRLINQLICINDLPSLTELKRVVAPYGQIILSTKIAKSFKSNDDSFDFTAKGQWAVAKMPYPKTIDSWPNRFYNAAKSNISKDQEVGPPNRIRWKGPEDWANSHNRNNSIMAVISAGGRLYSIMNKIPICIDDMPDRWFIICQDAFNGKELWRKPIDKWGFEAWELNFQKFSRPEHIVGRLVADEKHLYATLSLNAPLVQIDGATGKVLQTYKETMFCDEIVLKDGLLVLSVNTEAQKAGSISKDGIVTKRIVAIDATSGEVQWINDGAFKGFSNVFGTYSSLQRMTRLNILTGTDTVYIVNGNAIVCLSLFDGKERWQSTRTYGMNSMEKGAVLSGRFTMTPYKDWLFIHQRTKYLGGNKKKKTLHQSRLICLNSADGKIVWESDVGTFSFGGPDLYINKGLVWTDSIPTKDKKTKYDIFLVGRDPATGEIIEKISTKMVYSNGFHGRCYRGRATEKFSITGKFGTEFVDFNTGENYKNDWLRAVCGYGFVPANGLLYVPPHSCTCDLNAKINGFFALSSELIDDIKEEAENTFEKGVAYNNTNRTKASAKDWTHYRKDAWRLAGSTAKIEGQLESSWSKSFASSASSPIIVGKVAYMSIVNRNKIVALDCAKGTEIWSYMLDGLVDTPPTYYEGKLLFGDRNGWVTCLEAQSGKLAWRYRVAPSNRQVMIKGNLESPWPIHGSIVVYNERAYILAGRSTFLDGGMFLNSIDPHTGELLVSRRLDSRALETKKGSVVSTKSDLLVQGADGLYLRNIPLNSENLTLDSEGESTVSFFSPKKDGKNTPVLCSISALLDNKYSNRTYVSFGGQARADMIVADKDSIFGFRAFPLYWGSREKGNNNPGGNTHIAKNRHHTPGSGTYSLFCKKRLEFAPVKKNTRGYSELDSDFTWQQSGLPRILAMTVTADSLIIAGIPDVIGKDNPWAAFDGELGGILQIRDKKTGELRQEIKLEAPPVFNGIAVTEGQLIISLKNGKVLSIKKKIKSEKL